MFDENPADSGPLCSLCGLQPPAAESEGGIPLCKECRGEATAGEYSAAELARFHQQALERSGGAAGESDRALIRFYARCLDRPAFRVPFLQAASPAEFDRAMEAALVALETGYWRTRQGILVERAQGRWHLAHAPWRAAVDEVVERVERVRALLRVALELDRRPADLGLPAGRPDETARHRYLTHPGGLAQQVDVQRQQAIDILNAILAEIGDRPVGNIGG